MTRELYAVLCRLLATVAHVGPRWSVVRCVHTRFILFVILHCLLYILSSLSRKCSLLSVNVYKTLLLCLYFYNIGVLFVTRGRTPGCVRTLGHVYIIYDILKTTGCLQLLEISWNLNGPPGNFCVMIENFCVMIDRIGIRS